jgi:uracil-DNA glycosylase
MFGTSGQDTVTVSRRGGRKKGNMSNSKEARLNALAEEIRDLDQSPLYDYRKENDYRPVFGEGDVDAKIMFIGEAPGAQEAQTGRPFVGAAGVVLDDLLASRTDRPTIATLTGRRSRSTPRSSASRSRSSNPRSSPP